MTLILNNKAFVSNKTSEADRNVELFTISRWRYKNYQFNELVYNITPTSFAIYRCIAKHNSSEYDTTNGKFSVNPNGTLLWDNYANTLITSGDDGTGGNNDVITGITSGTDISEFYLSGTTLTLELNNGTQFTVDIDTVDKYITGGTLSGNTLILSDNSGGNLPGIDLSTLNPDTNKYIESGEVIGTDLVLTMNDATSVVVDVSSLIDDTNTYTTGGTYNNGEITLGLSDGSTVTINVDSIISEGSFLDLADTPSGYTGNEGKFLVVNDAGTGLSFFSSTILNGLTKHNYLTLTSGDFSLNGITGLYERTLTATELNAKEIVVHITLDNVSGSSYSYALLLPTVISSTHTAKKLTIICKELNISNVSLGLFVKSPWINSGTKNRILGKGKEYAFTNIGYIMPLETLEVAEIMFDGVDWILLNHSSEQYVEFDAKNFSSTDNSEYIIR